MLVLFYIMIDLAPHALHHVVLTSYLFMYVRSHGAGTRGANGASSSRIVH
jgi:hypothetical protein